MLPTVRALSSHDHLVRWLVIVGALMGLFAMHGLADHGTMHPRPEAAPGASMEMPTETSRAHDVEPAAVPRERDPVPAPSSDLLIGLCMAVVAAALGWLVAGRPTGQTTAILRHRLVQIVRTPAGARRDRDPPCLFSLSIQRC